jgi:hypothetical protein
VAKRKRKKKRATLPEIATTKHKVILALDFPEPVDPPEVTVQAAAGVEPLLTWQQRGKRLLIQIRDFVNR